MQYLALIQARCKSTRLPDKVLLELCGKPVLQHVIERVSKSLYVDEVAVVTSFERENLSIVQLCADLDVRVFVGSENDVLDRFYQCAKLLKPEYIVRVTADCPCYDWTVLDEAINDIMSETDYLADYGETLPDGLDIEVMRFTALEAAWRDATLKSEREHITQYIRKHPERFVRQDFSCPHGNLGHLRWTLDEEADLKLIKSFYEHFYALGLQDFLTKDILELLEAQPELKEINAHIARNEGLVKSVREDDFY